MLYSQCSTFAGTLMAVHIPNLLLISIETVTIKFVASVQASRNQLGHKGVDRRYWWGAIAPQFFVMKS